MKKLLLLCVGFSCVFFSLFAGEYADSQVEEYVRKQNIDRIKFWLDDNTANKNYVITSIDRTVLMLACEGAWAEGVQYLLKKGANPDYVTRQNMTATMFCVMNKRRYNAGILDMLVRAGANVNATDINGKTALMHAAEAGHVSAIQDLLTYGANPNGKSVVGMSALMYAVTSGSTSAVQVLSRQPLSGATDSNLEGDNILTLALKAPGDPLSMLRILKGANLGLSPSLRIDGMPVLFWAISVNKSPEVVKYLMDWYKNPKTLLSERDEDGHNLTFYAEYYDRDEVRDKLEHIAKITGKTQQSK